MESDPSAVTGESTKTQVLRDAAVFIPSSYIAQGLGMVNAFLIRALLGPAMMGIWATVQIVLNYGGYLHLGSMQAGAKEIPYHLGRKDAAKAGQIQDNIFSFGVLTTSLGAVLLIGGSFIYAARLTAPVRIGLAAAGLILVAQRVLNIAIMLLRGHKRFGLLSRLTIFTAVMDVLLTGLLVWGFGLYGLYAAVLGSLVLSLLYVWRKLPHSFSFTLDRDVLRGLAPIAFPMLMLGILFTLLRTMDKILIVKYMGATQLGIYSVALMASNYVFGLSNMMGMLTLPRYSEKFGDSGDVAVLAAYMDQAHAVMGTLLCVLLGAFYFVAPVVVKALLPQYTAGIPAMQMLLFGTFFLCLVTQPQNFLLAIGKQHLILPAVLAGTAVSFLLNYGVVRGPQDLRLIAVATSLSYVATFAWMFAACQWECRGKRSFRGALGEVLLPFVGVVTAVWGLERVFHGVNRWWVLPMQLLLYALLCVYPVRRMDQRSGILRKSWKILRDKVLAMA